MVEREAKVAEDRAKVARVIYNRLQRDMLLQVDATLIYGLGGDKERLLNRDLESDSPYNTYRRKGLPPTPIASPGRAALQAALAPEPGPWLFYVLADQDGPARVRGHRRGVRAAPPAGPVQGPALSVSGRR